MKPASEPEAADTDPLAVDRRLIRAARVLLLVLGVILALQLAL